MIKNENEEISVKWNVNNKAWYENRGYKFTGINDAFTVPVRDLYLGSTNKVHVICDYCGAGYKTAYYIIQNGRKLVPKDSCSRCTGKKASEVSKQKRAHNAILALGKTCDKYRYTLITTEKEYIDKHMKVKFICPKHGVQEMPIDNLIHGCQCFKCSYDDRCKSWMIRPDDVEKTIESFGDTWLNKSEYINSTERNLMIRCKCGNIYKASYQVFTRKSQTVCSVCSLKESSGERKIREFFEKNNIQFEQEKRFPDCKNIKPLPFDFYIPSINTCIEFDGKQHFEPVRGNASFESTKRHDDIKNKYCDANNISLVRIPYTSGSKISEILSELIEI